MKYFLTILFIMVLSSSCHKTEPPSTYVRKICYYQTNDPLLRIYNDVLIELVETKTYQLFLSKSLDLDSLMLTSNLYELTDTSEVYAEVNRLHNLYSERQKAIYNNPDLWCTVFLDDRLLDFLLVIKEHRRLLTSELQEVLKIDSLALTNYSPDTVQLAASRLNHQKFQSCTFKIAPLSEIQTRKHDCHIAQFKFSTIVLDKTQTKGWLYFEFVCGGTCGRGELLTIEQQNGRWYIKQSEMTWIS